MTNLVAVPFHNQILNAAVVDGIPHVAMKPICDNIGLQWEAQLKRIKRHPVLSQVISMMDMTCPGKDGKEYLVEMVMMPIKYLNGWLFGVDVNRVKPEIKDRLIEYQTECFDVLANHFIPFQSLPEPPTITKAQIGILFNKTKDIAAGSGKIRAEIWSRFQRKFDLGSYKDLPADQYDAAIEYLNKKSDEYLGEGVTMQYVSNQELEALVNERVKAIQGEYLEKSDNQLSLTFDHLSNDVDRMLLVKSCGQLSIKPIDKDCFVLNREQIKKNLHEVFPGQVLVDKQVYQMLVKLAEKVRLTDEKE